MMRSACRQMAAPKTPKKKEVVRSVNPADGVIRTSPAIAPINAESSDHFPVSNYVMQAQVMVPPEAHRLVTHMAMTDLKFRLSAVPASKASQELHMMTMAIS